MAQKYFLAYFVEHVYFLFCGEKTNFERNWVVLGEIIIYYFLFSGHFSNQWSGLLDFRPDSFETRAIPSHEGLVFASEIP